MDPKPYPTVLTQDRPETYVYTRPFFRVSNFGYQVWGIKEIDILLPSNQRQHRALHIQKDALPYAWCELLCPVLAALSSIFRMSSISTSYP